MRLILAICLGVVLIGCAEIPKRIAQAPAGDLQLDEAASNMEDNEGQPVRWGGTVMSVSEENNHIWIEIQQHGLGRYGAPRQSNCSQGRFLVKTKQLPDELPMLIGMDVTVFGGLGGSFNGSIGREPYLFPVVNAKEHYLWGPEYSAVYPRFYDDYYSYYSPWYSDWDVDYYPHPAPLYPYSLRSRFHLYGLSHRPRYRHGIYYYWGSSPDRVGNIHLATPSG